MSETWLKPGISDDLVRLPGYTLYRCDRVDRAGGGVGFFICSSINVVILEHSEVGNARRPEFMIAELAAESVSKVLLAMVYRPPHTGYLSEFENKYQELQTTYLHSIIVGDFNTDMLTDSFDRTHLCSFISASGLHLVL